MNYLLRTFFVAFLSVILLCIMDYFLPNGHGASSHNTSLGDFLAMCIVYGFPLYFLAFVALAVINFFVQRPPVRMSARKFIRSYFVIGLGVGIAIVMAFATFDYLQRGREFHPRSFFEIFVDYSGALLVVVVGVASNWLFVLRRKMNRVAPPAS